MKDDRRIQLDLKDLPEGVVPKLREKALDLDYKRFSAFARDVFLREAGFENTAR